MAYIFNPFLDDLDYYEAAGAAANGLPTGGTANQKLTKIDATDFNAQWVDDTGGGGDIEGGSSSSIYLIAQVINGGTA